MKGYRSLKIMSEKTFNFTLEAEVPCIVKNQPDKVVKSDQGNSEKTSDNVKVQPQPPIK